MSLSAADRRLVRLFTAIVLGRWDEVVRVREHAAPGEPDRRWREAVLQVHVFAGFPRLVEAYGVLASAGGLGVLDADERSERSSDAQPSDAQLNDARSNEARSNEARSNEARSSEAGPSDAAGAAHALFRDRRAGRGLFQQIYADEAPRVRAMLEAYHPDFAAWIEGHAYGRVLARGGLSADRRELLAVAALAALGQERQLASHVRGSLRLGATRAELAATLAEVADLIERERLEKATRVLAHFGNGS